MKKITNATMLLTCFCMVFSSMLQAQTTIPNGAFENWQNVGANTEEPTNWNGNKTGGGNATLGPQTCFREGTNPHTGTYCLKLDNASFFGTGINATATTGRIEAPTTNPVDGYIRTKTDDANFASPFTGRPDSLVGWYRFTQAGGNIGRISAILHDSFNVSNPDQGGSAAHIIGETLFDLPNASTATWTRFAVPFTYTNSTDPRYILLIATACNAAGSANANTIMWVDDLEAVYCTNATATINTTACGSYTAPSGQVYTASGTYVDVVQSVHGLSGDCDSVYTINLTINNNATGTDNLTACNSYTWIDGNTYSVNNNTAMHTLVGAAANGCDSIVTLNLIVNNADITVTTSATSLMSNAVGAVYQWVDCNNGFAPIPGETNATFTPTMSGDYAVEVTENNCTEFSGCYNFVYTGVTELAFDSKMAIYPNPTNGQFTVDLGGNYNDVNLVITDINGKTVYNTVYNQSSTIQLDLNQPAGLYIVSVTSGNKHAVAKLIKQ